MICGSGLGRGEQLVQRVIVWNLMLDTDRGPNATGMPNLLRAVDIDPNNFSSITRNSHYYIVGHLSSVVKPERAH